MIRGAKKNMIVVRTRDSRMFEEAYFVMRRDSSLSRIEESDMLWEANRILESAVPRAEQATCSPVTAERGRRRREAIWFLLGLVSGSGIMGLLWLLL